MIEVEVKVRVDDLKNIERSIIALGAVPIGIDNQEDTYYNNLYRDFGKTDEALRIRVQDGEYSFTYKGPKLDSVSKTREEFEVKINDADSMGDILSSLGFFPVATVVKKRKKYRMRDIFIALDDVQNLGNFMEIELMVKDSGNYTEKIEAIFKFIEKLGMNRKAAVRTSYLEMLLEKRKHK